MVSVRCVLKSGHMCKLCCAVCCGKKREKGEYAGRTKTCAYLCDMREGSKENKKSK